MRYLNSNNKDLTLKAFVGVVQCKRDGEISKNQLAISQFGE